MIGKYDSVKILVKAKSIFSHYYKIMSVTETPQTNSCRKNYLYHIN